MDSSRRPPGVPRALWQAYGDRYPGGVRRTRENDEAAEALRARVEPAAPGSTIALTNYCPKVCASCGECYTGKNRRYCSRACYRLPQNTGRAAELRAALIAELRRRQLADPMTTDRVRAVLVERLRGVIR